MLDYVVIQAIHSLAHYDMEQNILTFGRKHNFNQSTFYDLVKDFEAKKWVVIVKDIRANKVTLIVKDQVILANNIIKILDILYNDGVLEASKHLDKLNNDFKEVLKDYDNNIPKG